MKIIVAYHNQFFTTDEVLQRAYLKVDISGLCRAYFAAMEVCWSLKQVHLGSKEPLLLRDHPHHNILDDGHGWSENIRWCLRLSL